MQPSAAQIARVVDTLVTRLVAGGMLVLTASEEAIRSRFVAVLTRNFEEEAEIEREATAEAEKLVRRGAPGVKREDLDLRKVEQLVRQRLAQARGFAL